MLDVWLQVAEFRLSVLEGLRAGLGSGKDQEKETEKDPNPRKWSAPRAPRRCGCVQFLPNAVFSFPVYLIGRSLGAGQTGEAAALTSITPQESNSKAVPGLYIGVSMVGSLTVSKTNNTRSVRMAKYNR